MKIPIRPSGQFTRFLSIRRVRLLTFMLATIVFPSVSNAGVVLGGVNLGNLPNYLFAFVDGQVNGVIDYNLQAASPGYQGNIAVNGIAAGTDLTTSGHVPYQGTMVTNAATLDSWQAIINDNNVGGTFPTNNATALYNQVGTLAGLQTDLNSAFAQINLLPTTLTVTDPENTVALGGLDGLNTQNGINETFVINITGGFQVSSQINITGDAGDIYILRWDTDANPLNGYNGQVKFQSGGAIVPHGGLSPTNFISVAGDIDASGGGSTPPLPYPQGIPNPPVAGGDPFSGGGFFTGYWLTTGDPTNNFETHSLSNAAFVGGWYTSTSKFSLTSGSGGIYVPPPTGPNVGEAPEPSTIALALSGLVPLGLAAWRRRRRASA